MAATSESRRAKRAKQPSVKEFIVNAISFILLSASLPIELASAAGKSDARLLST